MLLAAVLRRHWAVCLLLQILIGEVLNFFLFTVLYFPVKTLIIICRCMCCSELLLNALTYMLIFLWQGLNHLQCLSQSVTKVVSVSYNVISKSFLKSQHKDHSSSQKPQYNTVHKSLFCIQHCLNTDPKMYGLYKRLNIHVSGHFSTWFTFFV